MSRRQRAEGASHICVRTRRPSDTVGLRTLIDVHKKHQVPRNLSGQACRILLKQLWGKLPVPGHFVRASLCPPTVYDLIVLQDAAHTASLALERLRGFHFQTDPDGGMCRLIPALSVAPLNPSGPAFFLNRIETAFMEPLGGWRVGKYPAHSGVALLVLSSLDVLTIQPTGQA